MSPHIVCGCQIVAFSDRIRYAVPHIVCGSRIHVHCAAFTPAAPQDHEERKKNKKKKNKKDKKRNARPSDSEEDRKKKKQEKKERKKKREEEGVDVNAKEDEAIADAIADADQQRNVESRSPAYNADALAVAVPSPEEVADAACADITEPIRKGEVYRAALQAAQVAADGPAPETPALAAKSKSMKR